MSPKHGEYEPGKGFYSAVSQGWHTDPTKIGGHIPAENPEHKRDEMQRWGKRKFEPQPQFERLIQLRDSDRADDRAKFEKIARGNTRITLNDYEAAKAKAEGEGA